MPFLLELGFCLFAPTLSLWPISEVVAHAFSSRTEEEEAGGPELHSEGRYWAGECGWIATVLA